MKIGKLNILWHKHKWEKAILHEGDAVYGYFLKVAEKCIAPDCREGYYRSVYYIYCKNRPLAYKVD